MSDAPKDQADGAHDTMPPELRPFVKPASPQKLVTSGDEPEFKAAVDVLRLLNGGPSADPFFPEAGAAAATTPQGEGEAPGGERPGAASVTAYVPPAVLPSAELSVRKSAPGKVVIIGVKPAGEEDGRGRGKMVVGAILVVVVGMGVVWASGIGRTRGAVEAAAPSATMSAAMVPTGVTAAPTFSAAPGVSAASSASVAPSASAAAPKTSGHPARPGGKSAAPKTTAAPSTTPPPFIEEKPEF